MCWSALPHQLLETQQGRQQVGVAVSQHLGFFHHLTNKRDRFFFPIFFFFFSHRPPIPLLATSDVTAAPHGPRLVVPTFTCDVDFFYFSFFFPPALGVNWRGTHNVARLLGGRLRALLPVDAHKVGEGGGAGEQRGGLGAEEGAQHLFKEQRRGDAFHAADCDVGQLQTGGRGGGRFSLATHTDDNEQNDNKVVPLGRLPRLQSG